MSFGTILYTIIIQPLMLLFEVLYMIAYKITGSPGGSILALSLAMNLLVLPLYIQADAMQEEERDIESRLHDGVEHIKRVFKGDERMMILQTYYRQNHYKPTDVFKGSVSLFLEIPFFIAAYRFLANLEPLKGAAFGVIRDLGAADELIHIGSLSLNLLPMLMTGVNLISCLIFTKGYPKKTKIQLYGMAVFFFFFLYKSPAGLVFYWTLNNIFSLVKTIFYKLKNPKRVLKMIAASVGIVLVLFSLFIYQTVSLKRKILLIILGCVFMLPLFIQCINTNAKRNIIIKRFQRHPKLFRVGSIYLTLLFGLLIPSSVLVTSPQEFVDLFSYKNPLWYVFSSLCLAVGTFIVWLSIFRGLCQAEKQKWFDACTFLACGIATMNYMFFGRKLGILDSNLVYERNLSFTSTESVLNLVAIFVVGFFLFVFYLFIDQILTTSVLIISIAILIMSTMNIMSIEASVRKIDTSVVLASENEPEITLSRAGKNVVIMMLDRAMGELVPYIFEERAELQKIYDGFTYYPNTLSYGSSTNIGAPALFGGYEYTPWELNQRESELLVTKHNEALKVMPVMFSEAGFKVTVFDPTYANYQWKPDATIYEDYPDIKTYVTEGRYFSTAETGIRIQNRFRNFFCYSVMKCMPLIGQDFLYDDGNYFNSKGNQIPTNGQIATSPYVASGYDYNFLEAFTVLENLSNITHYENDSKDTFLLMSNDATHEPMLLQEPEYVYSEYVNNETYEKQHKDRFTLNGVSLSMIEEEQFKHYDVNMAAFIQIGKWLETLKKENVYDNTKIILVSDHGRGLEMLEGKMLGDGELYDIEYYYPLLMVKDFNATGFQVSEEFMTNADVPTIATENIVSNATNPFTGNTINNLGKSAEMQYVLGSDKWETRVNNGTKFLPGIWFSVKDDVRDSNNWEVVQEYSESPFEDIH